MSTHGTLGSRIALCRLRLGAHGGRTINQTEFGKVVAVKAGRRRPFATMTVSRWEADSAQPDLDVLRVIARLTAVDPGWLAFGKDSSASAPQATLLERR